MWFFRKDDFYITLLKYARERTVEGKTVNYLEVLAHLESRNDHLLR